MKRTKRISSLLLLFLVPVLVMAQVRSLKAARDIASKHHLDDSSTMLRSSQLLSAQSHRASDAFYVFTQGSQQHGSFVIVAADERMGDVLAYSDESAFPLDVIPDNVQWWLERCADYYQAVGNAYASSASYSITGSVDPLVSTRWAQLEPFNLLCPVVDGNRTATGCVATAMAQALSVFRQPQHATGSVQYVTKTHKISIDVNLADHPFLWDTMLDSYVNGYTQAQAEAVSNLMYACGVSLFMDYGRESATPTSNIIASAVNNFGYDADMVFATLDDMKVSDWHRLLTNNLKAGMPVIYSAMNEYGEGHCFIIDGFTSASSDPFYHVNWGWGGMCNGDYRIFNLSPSETGTGGGSGNFNIKNTAILGFKPDNGIAENGGFLQAHSVSVSPENIAPGVVSAVLNIKSLYNYGSRPFSGDILVYAARNGAQEELLSTAHLDNVPFMNGVGSLDIPLSLSPYMSAGDYQLKVYTRSDGADKQLLYCPEEFPVLTLSPSRDSYQPRVMVSDLTLDVDSDGQVYVNATHLLNNDDIDISCSLSLAILDVDGKVSSLFGQGEDGVSLLSGKPYTDIKTLNGVLPQSLPDGKYNISLAVRPALYSSWTPVTGYVIEDGQVVPDQTPRFCVIKKEDGIVSVSYEDLPVFYPSLEALSLTLAQYNASSSLATVSASSLANFSDRDFIGSLSLAVCDEEGNVLSSSPESVEIDQPLGSGTTLPAPISVSGSFIVPSSDGRYSLRLMAHQKYCQGWSLVNRYVRVLNNITDHGLPCTVDFWIIDGVLSFDEPTVYVESISLNKERLYMRADEQITLFATVLPQNATDISVTWSSSNTAVATVNSYGTVTAHAVGEAVITATAQDGGGATATCPVTVLPTLAESIRLNHSSYSLDIGSSVQLQATVLPYNTTNKTVSWATSDASVATVDDNGLVTCLATGAANITATTTDGSNLTATCAVGSRNYLVEAIFVNPPEVTLAVGESIRLSVIVLPADAVNKVVEWSSNDPSVVTVNQSGFARVISDGRAVVYATATDGSNVSGSCIFNCTNGIVTVTATDNVRIFSPDGKPLAEPQRGLNIIIGDDGTVRKIVYP